MSVRTTNPAQWLRAFFANVPEGSPWVIGGRVKVKTAPGGAAPILHVNNPGGTIQRGLYYADDGASVRIADPGGGAWGVTPGSTIATLSTDVWTPIALKQSSPAGVPTLRGFVGAAKRSDTGFSAFALGGLNLGSDYYIGLDALYADLWGSVGDLDDATIAALMAAANPWGLIGAGSLLIKASLRGGDINEALGTDATGYPSGGGLSGNASYFTGGGMASADAANFSTDNPTYVTGLEISADGEIPVAPPISSLIASPATISAQAGTSAVPITITGNDGNPLPGSIAVVALAPASGVGTVSAMAEDGTLTFTPTAQGSATLSITWDPPGDDPPIVVQIPITVTAASVAPPTISLSASATDVQSAQTVTLTAVPAASSPATVQSVQFFVNGSPYGAALTAAPWQRIFQPASSGDNGSYAFTARVTDSAGNTATSAAVNVVVSIAPPVVTPPAAPSNLTASNVTQSTLVLNVTNNAPLATRVMFERRTPSGAFQQVADVTLAELPVTVGGQLAGGTYVFRARVTNGTTPSGYSPELQVTMAAAPATNLAGIIADKSAIAGLPGAQETVIVTARDANLATLPGVRLTASTLNPAVATVTPANAVTDSAGNATLQVTFGTTAGKTALHIVANDSVATVSNDVTDILARSTLSLAAIEQMLAEQSAAKYATEVIAFVLDFTDDLVGDEQITNVRQIQILDAGTGVDATAAMASGDPRVVSPGYVVQYVKGGDLGRPYWLRGQCDTSAGEVIEAELRFRIYPVIGRKRSL